MEERVYFLDNPRIHWEQGYRFELPRWLPFLQIVSLYFKIQETKIGFFGQIIWNWSPISVYYAFWTVNLAIYCDTLDNK